MINRFKTGLPIETAAIPSENRGLYKDNTVLDINAFPNIMSTNKECIDGLYKFSLSDKAMVFGLGETVRGINKKGWIYESFCADDPNHQEGKRSLYGAHHFIVIKDDKCFGLFIDNPGRVTFDIGYTDRDRLVIKSENPEQYIYLIDGNEPYDIIKQFLRLIGKAYIPPKWAFGFGQSRWGYNSAENVREVVRQHRENHIPIDMVYMDIDYMEGFRDFTVREDNFPDFSAFVREMHEQHIHLVPIIDAGIKEEAGYDIYDEGEEGGFFCKDADGNTFVAAVWPGRSVFPDFMNKESRDWFGSKYKKLIDAGIDGFWNDMNEPALFYTPIRLKKAVDKVNGLSKGNPGIDSFFEISGSVNSLQNSLEDYESFYHKMDDGSVVRHDRVHNLYGMNMTRAAAEKMKEDYPDKEFLLFSRASYIGAHRYGGIWQGDNKSWWSHLKMNVAMTANLNMCGFLFTGADTGGFGDDVTEDLLIRWLSFSIFTPLMRNHSATGTREQEFYRFKDTDTFRHIIGIRYRLLPYIYESYLHAAENYEMLLRPLVFDYPYDERVLDIEDELMLGDRILIAPVVEQNKNGRMVYLPEDMIMVRLTRDAEGRFLEERSEVLAGDNYINVPLSDVVFFLKKGMTLELSEFKEYID